MEKNSIIKTYNISNAFLDEANRIVTRSNIKFIYDRKTSRGEFDDKNINDGGQIMHHLFYDNSEHSEHYSFFAKVFDETDISVKQILRMKINVTFPLIDFKDNNYQIPHYDINNVELRPDLKFKSFLVYLNESDGDTFFFKDNKIDKRVKHEKGKGLLFDSSLLHAGQNPMKHNLRIVLNTIFLSGDE